MFSFSRLSATVAIVLVAALSLSGSADAQDSSVTCVYASWANNGDNQNACQVWATLGSKCGTFNVPALGTSSNGSSPGYPAPSSSGGVPNNDCHCNLIAYSLMAACSWCQEGVYADSWPTIAEWSAGCSSFNSNGVATSVNTTGINVPPYAVQTIATPWWDPTDAQAAQVSFGSSGTANSTNSHHNGAGVTRPVGTMLSLLALAPVYLLL